MLKECGIEASYTIDEILENKDEILTKILDNKEAVSYIIENPEEFKFKICNSQVAIKELANNENTKKALINNKEWLLEIQNSEYANIFNEYASTIEKMTSKEGPGGVATATSTQADSSPHYAFDKDIDTGWCQTEGSHPENELIYTYTDFKNIYKFKVSLQSVTNSATSNSLKIYISPSETQEDWKQICDEAWSWGKYDNSLHVTNILLDEVQKVKRIKIKSNTVCFLNEAWAGWIKEVEAYGY